MNRPRPTDRKPTSDRNRRISANRADTRSQCGGVKAIIAGRHLGSATNVGADKSTRRADGSPMTAARYPSPLSSVNNRADRTESEPPP
uniref:Uncharacterized protein n=1 Tax=Plectus sambesii TaxID=2011161 RepID=A0A914XM12_9BILA